MPPEPRTRRRGEVLERAILDAAWAALVEDGYVGFTYENIAARAATSRPVLSRHWPTRDGLLLAALRRQWHPVVAPDTGTLRGDAVALLESVNDERAHSVAVMVSQLGDYFRRTGTNFSELRLLLRADQPSSSPLDAILQRAIDRGELPATPRRRVATLPLDLLRHELLITLKPVEPATIIEIVDEIWLPLLTQDGFPR